MRPIGEVVERGVSPVSVLLSYDAGHRLEQKRQSGSPEMVICARRRKYAVDAVVAVAIHVAQDQVQNLRRKIGDGGGRGPGTSNRRRSRSLSEHRFKLEHAAEVVKLVYETKMRGESHLP